MTNPPPAHSSPEPTHHQHQFYLGFLAGAAIGAGIAYVSTHKKGGHIKKELIHKAKQLVKELPDLLDYLRDEEEQIKENLEENFEEAKDLVTSNPDQPADVPEPTPVEKAVNLTTSKTKRFFSQAGRLLRKKIG